VSGEKTDLFVKVTDIGSSVPSPDPVLEKSTVNDAAEMIIEVAGMGFRWNRSSPPVFESADLSVQRSKRVFIEGPSGSGKSTLLSLLAGVITPQHGSITVLGRRVDALSSGQRDRFRADHIGFIFQMFNLIPYLSVVENVTLPCRFSALRRERALRSASNLNGAALALLDGLDMAGEEIIDRPVSELSVGQQQRVAAARALMGAPEVLIADEPTSALDTDLREDFIRLLFDRCAEEGTTLVFVSHDRSLEGLFDRTVRLTGSKNPLSLNSLEGEALS
jgi:putative ABC transport system ATP-binding protein